MTQEELFKEMNSKVHTCTLPNKLIMQAMICITMTYEALYITACASSAADNVPYVPHTMIQYLQLIDRPAYLLHVTTVTAALLTGTVAPAVSPFSETLPDTHDELQNAFDVHVALLHWNVVHAGAQGAALNAAQALKRRLFQQRTTLQWSALASCYCYATQYAYGSRGYFSSFYTRRIARR